MDSPAARPGSALGTEPREAREPAPTTFVLRRLFAERLTDAHLPLLRRMDNNAQMMASLGGVRSDAETEGLPGAQPAHWEEHGFGIWILRDPMTGRVFGRAGLRHLSVEGDAGSRAGLRATPGVLGAGPRHRRRAGLRDDRPGVAGASLGRGADHGRQPGLAPGAAQGRAGARARGYARRAAAHSVQD